MRAHRVDVFDKADRDHVALGIADDLKFQLLPAKDGFLNEYLADQTCRQSARADGL